MAIREFRTASGHGFVAGNHNFLRYFDTHEEALNWARLNAGSIPTFVAELTHTLVRPQVTVKPLKRQKITTNQENS